MTEKRGQQLPGSAKAMTFIGGGGRWGQLAADFFFFLIHLPLNKIVPINKALTQNRFQRGKKQTQDARQPHTQKRL